jgi:LuxR family maltose regulon positive regulatory protein
MRALAAFHLGDRDQAAHDLDAALEVCQQWRLVDMRAHCLAVSAQLAVLNGEPDQATVKIDEARDLVFDHGLENVASIAPVFSASSGVLLATGRTSLAEGDAMRALRLTALFEAVAPWHAVGGRLTLSQVFWHLGDSQRANVLCEEATERYLPAAQCTVLDQMVKQTKELMMRTDGPLSPSLLTTAELRVLQYLPSHLSFPEIGQHLFLSRHTVKSQALSAYRKLGVTSRSQAVDRARGLGLLPTARSE